MHAPRKIFKFCTSRQNDAKIALHSLISGEFIIGPDEFSVGPDELMLGPKCSSGPMLNDWAVLPR